MKAWSKVLGAALGAVLAVLAVAAPADAAKPYEGIGYDLDGTPVPSPPRLNQLDLYAPDDVGAGAARPVVVYVHGGGWANGDKSNRLTDKINLFTGAGYMFASVNYRLANSPVDPSYPPTRVRFPTIPSDVAEAVGWLDRNVSGYGGDPRRLLLIGHSAGAQLVSLISTDPSYLTSWGVDPAHVLGTVSLDTDTYDVTQRATTGNVNAKTMIYNAIATPEENAVDGAWARYSATNYADPSDPDFLLVTQSKSPSRIASTEQMATLLGQDPASSVFRAPYDHEGINAAVGAADDYAGETNAIMSFFAAQAGPVQPATSKVAILKRPQGKIKLRKGKRAKVRFRFEAANASGASSFACRIDKKRERRCGSPKSYEVKPGRHTFRVVAISAAGERGPTRKIGFKVVDKRR